MQIFGPPKFLILNYAFSLILEQKYFFKHINLFLIREQI